MIHIQTEVDRSGEWGEGEKGARAQIQGGGYATSLSLSGQIDNLCLLQYGDKKNKNNNKKKITTWNSIYQPWQFISST